MVARTDAALEKQADDLIAQTQVVLNAHTKSKANEELERHLAEMDRQMNKLRANMMLKLGPAALYVENQVKNAYKAD